MPFIEFKNVRIAGMSAGVPKHTVDNLNAHFADYSAEDFVKTTSVRRRRVGDYTTSDLCLPAAEQLIADLGWEKSEIGALVFVSQTADYFLPATACVLQHKLGLGKDCYAMDISLGCSGWTYGMSSVLGLMQSGGITKALLMAGDARGHLKTHNLGGDPLFGMAGTVTALEYKEGAKGFSFSAGTDGSGYEAIIQPGGGARNPFCGATLDLTKDDDGVYRTPLYVRMKGMDVFAFGITTVPKTVKKLLQHAQTDISTVDYFVFHQANHLMNEKIKAKLKLSDEQVPYCMHDFGNTSSASIPLTIVTQLADVVRTESKRFVTCGFGVGLSWATLLFDTDGIVISDLVEVGEDDETKE